MAKTQPTPEVLRALARQRLSLPPEDLRTPAERRRDNDELVRRLEGRLPPELYQRVVEVIFGRDVHWNTLERALGTEKYLAVCEAILIMDREG